MIHKEKPAFPSTPATTEWREGITIRDYFAAKAMQGLFSSMGEITNSWSKMAKDIPLKEYISNYSYEIADEMLKQREL